MQSIDALIQEEAKSIFQAVAYSLKAD